MTAATDLAVIDSPFPDDIEAEATAREETEEAEDRERRHADAARKRELERPDKLARELENQRLRDEARDLRAAEKAEALVESLAPAQTLTELLATPLDPVKFRVDQLWAVDGRILVTAQFKAGKSTLVGNVIKSLVDGDPLLGKFTVEPPTGKVYLIDNELSTHTLHEWLADQAIANTDRVHIDPLRGHVSTFAITTPSIRTFWAERIKASGATVLIIDCFRPILDALGMDEKADAGKMLIAIDELAAEAGIAEVMVIHHMGHDNERARGDSRLRDWPDAAWTIVRQSEDPSSTRYFSAYGRDVDIPEGALAYNPTTRRLALVGGNRKTAPLSGVKDTIVKFLDANPKASKKQLETSLIALGGITRKQLREALVGLINDDIVTTETGPKQAILHSLDVPLAALDSLRA